MNYFDIKGTVSSFTRALYVQKKVVQSGTLLKSREILPVSSIYIWSEIFRSPSEAKYGDHGGPELRRFQSIKQLQDEFRKIYFLLLPLHIVHDNYNY